MSSKYENVKLAISAIDHKINKLNHRRSELEALLTKLSSKGLSVSSVQRTPSVSEPQATLNRGATVTGAKMPRASVTPAMPSAAKGVVTGLCPEEEHVVRFYLEQIKAGLLNYDKASEFMPTAYHTQLRAAGLDPITSLRKCWDIALNSGK